jgi:hypothetical protein
MQSSPNGVNESQRVKFFRLLWGRLMEHPLSRIGPGLITGVADDDPSGIATYSQAGAQFGLNMLWTMPLAFPLMAAIQSMCARIGRVTGKGLAANIKSAFPPIVLQCVVLLLLIANTLKEVRDGRFHRKSTPPHPRLDRDDGHGRGGHTNVHSRLGAEWLCTAHPVLSGDKEMNRHPVHPWSQEKDFTADERYLIYRGAERPLTAQVVVCCAAENFTHRRIVKMLSSPDTILPVHTGEDKHSGTLDQCAAQHRSAIRKAVRMASYASI